MYLPLFLFSVSDMSSSLLAAGASCILRKILVDPATKIITTGFRGMRHVADVKNFLGPKDMLMSKPRRVKKDGCLNIKVRHLELSNPLSIDNCIYMNWLTIIWLLIMGFLFC